MLEAPQIHLLFDLTALLNAKTYQWLEFSEVGQCFVPQIVYQEIQALAASGSESFQAKMAREFRRFFAESDWQLTDLGTGSCSAINASRNFEGYKQPRTKRAQLAASIAEFAQRFARSSAGRMVVLISEDRALLQQIQALQLPNLSGLPVNALLIWGRTGRRPPVIVQHLQAMQERLAQLVVAQPGGSVSSLPSQNIPKPALTPLPKSAPSNVSLRLTVGAAIALLVGFSIWLFPQPKNLRPHSTSNLSSGENK